MAETEYCGFTSRMEELLCETGAFLASLSKEYHACWIRDQLYTSIAYYYTGEYEKLKRGIRVVFDIFKKFRWKIERNICAPPAAIHEYVHAKYNPLTLEEITNEWGHHQLCALGLFLHIVADLDLKNIPTVENRNDAEIIQLIIMYLNAVRYWENPDNGMWEESLDLHSSSIGAVLGGLSYIQRRQIAIVPEPMITLGRTALNRLLPNESPAREVDMSQLSLIWPYNIISRDTASIILERIKSKLVQKHGVNRYYGDNYYRSSNGVSAEWPMGFFWLAIVCAQRHEAEEAEYWFMRGCAEITPKGKIPELFQNGKPNKNRPLAWAHSLAEIAKMKLENLKKPPPFQN